MSYAPFDLDSRTAVVIVGTSGIGRAIAQDWPKPAPTVIASPRRHEQVGATAKEIEERGRRTIRVTSDVATSTTL